MRACVVCAASLEERHQSTRTCSAMSARGGPLQGCPERSQGWGLLDGPGTRWTPLYGACKSPKRRGEGGLMV